MDYILRKIKKIWVLPAQGDFNFRRIRSLIDLFIFYWNYGEGDGGVGGGS